MGCFHLLFWILGFFSLEIHVLPLWKNIFNVLWFSSLSLFSLSRTQSDVRLHILKVCFVLWTFKNSIPFFCVLCNIFYFLTENVFFLPLWFLLHAFFSVFSSKLLFWFVFIFFSLTFIWNVMIVECLLVLRVMKFLMTDRQLLSRGCEPGCWHLGHKSRAVGSVMWTFT